MLKKARFLTRPTLARRDAPRPKQGRRRVETGGGTDRTPWGRSPVQWILANGKTPSALPTSENLNRYVEDFDEPRTTLADFFSILLGIDDCRIDRVAGQFLSTLKALEFHEKVEPGDLASQLPNERHRGGCRASCGQ